MTFSIYLLRVNRVSVWSRSYFSSVGCTLYYTLYSDKRCCSESFVEGISNRRGVAAELLDGGDSDGLRKRREVFPVAQTWPSLSLNAAVSHVERIPPLNSGLTY